MSEEGEADFDAGQILEDVLEQFPDEAKCSPRHERHPATGSNSSGRDGGALDANGSDTATGAPAAKGVSDTIRSAHRNSGYIDGSRRGEHDMRYGEALPPRSPGPNRRTSDEDYYHRQGTGRMRARSRSKHRSQSREYVRRAPPEYENNYESVPLRRGEQPRPDEGEHRESPYRPNRYGERDFSRSAYYRRTEREPSRYKRRETERQPYSHTGYNAREGADGGDAERRNVDKDRAIEELRLRVRATSDRPADDLTSGTRDRSPLAVHVPAATREPGPATATRPTEDSLAMRDRSASEMEVVKPQTSGDTAPVNSEGAVQLGPSVDMDDIEEAPVEAGLVRNAAAAVVAREHTMEQTIEGLAVAVITPATAPTAEDMTTKQIVARYARVNPMRTGQRAIQNTTTLRMDPATAAEHAARLTCGKARTGQSAVTMAAVMTAMVVPIRA
ncbi:hypothetical protein GGI04_001116 [Coemansia thaxteri]|nr:hypothetical protein GGI04_001116 [Coemansia thaxteri]